MAGGLFPEWPYTNFHEQNLEWYIHKTGFLLKEVRALKDRLDSALQEISDKVDEKLLEMRHELDQIEADILATLERIQRETEETLADARKEFADFIARQQAILDQFSKQIEAYNQYIKSYVDTQIQILRDLIESPIEGPVFNYFRQEVTPIQVALEDYYNYLRPHAFRAGWFDRQGITVGEWDGLGKTALEWDLEGEHIIRNFKRQWPWLAYDPWTGLKVPMAELIYRLTEYHGVGLTTGQWDAMTYTAGEFDAAGYQAFTLDWSNAPLELDKVTT